MLSCIMEIAEFGDHVFANQLREDKEAAMRRGAWKGMKGARMKPYLESCQAEVLGDRSWPRASDLGARCT